MNITIKNLPLYWRVKNTKSNHSFIPANSDFKLFFDKDLQIFRQNVDMNLAKVLNEIYNQNSNIGYIQDSPIADMKYAVQFDEIISKFIINSKVLEIGNGSHFFAKKFNKDYKSFISVDPSCNEQSLLENHIHLNGFYPDVIDKNDKFDLIFHYNFLEHTFDCLNILKANFNNLENDGSLVFAVPDNTESIYSGDIGFCMHEHIFYFSKTSAIHILKLAGFSSVIFIKSSYGGSLIVIAKKNKNTSIDFIKNSTSNPITFFDNFNKKIEFLHSLDLNNYSHYVPLRAFPYLCYLNKNLDDFFFVDDKLGLFNLFYDGCNSPIRNLDLSPEIHKNFIIYSITFGSQISKKITNLYNDSNIVLIGDI